jgi:hypothetical protein
MRDGAPLRDTSIQIDIKKVFRPEGDRYPESQK